MHQRNAYSVCDSCLSVCLYVCLSVTPFCSLKIGTPYRNYRKFVYFGRLLLTRVNNRDLYVTVHAFLCETPSVYSHNTPRCAISTTEQSCIFCSLLSCWKTMQFLTSCQNNVILSQINWKAVPQSRTYTCLHGCCRSVRQHNVLDVAERQNAAADDDLRRRPTDSQRPARHIGSSHVV